MLALLIAATALAAPTWSDISSYSSWETYSTRSHAHAGDVQVLKGEIKGIPCFKGLAKTSVSGEALLDVAADIDGSIKWSSAGVTEAELLSKTPTTMEYYQYLDVPGWTLSADRFWFLTSNIEKSQGTIVFNWTHLVEGGAHSATWRRVKRAHPDAVEPPVNVGGWIFRREGSQTRIEYYICSDTGGSIPTAVQNAATTRTLPDTVGDLVKEAKRRQ